MFRAALLARVMLAAIVSAVFGGSLFLDNETLSPHCS
jgi:hypothetical protein